MWTVNVILGLDRVKYSKLQMTHLYYDTSIRSSPLVLFNCFLRSISTWIGLHASKPLSFKSCNVHCHWDKIILDFNCIMSKPMKSHKPFKLNLDWMNSFIWITKAFEKLTIMISSTYTSKITRFNPSHLVFYE